MNMDTDSVHEVNVSLEDVGTRDLDVESDKIDLVVEASSNGDTSRELETAGGILIGTELDLACVAEKLVNLTVLMMHVATKETDFEAFASSNDVLADSVEKALEFDFLSEILDAEAMELDKLMMNIQENIFEVGGIISSNGPGGTFMALEEKLRDSQESLKQSKDQVSEIRAQSVKFQRTFSCLHGEENGSTDKGSNFLEDNQLSSMTSKINMQTAEQQRHFLRMLEKSLAREMDFEKKLTESRRLEEELKDRVLSIQQEVFFIEEETMDVYEKWFEKENAAEVLMGISKELLGRLQIFQLNLNGLMKREAELRSKLENSIEQLEAKEIALQKFDSNNAKLSLLVAKTDSLKASLSEAENNLVLANSEAFTLREKVTSLENQLRESEFQLSAKVSADRTTQEQHNALGSEINEMKNVTDTVKEKLSKAESRADDAEVKLKLLEETNMKLDEELGHLKDTSEKVDFLERELRESDFRLRHAVASADASQEKENMLYATIRDMENVIEGLKSKVSKAESHADSVEDKCIILSETNADLNEELSFLRGRLECLEASLNHAEEKKMATSKDICIRTKVITDLVMQLAIERERLHKQVASLALQNQTLVMKLQQASKDAFVDTKYHNKGNGEKFLFTDHDVSKSSATISELEKAQKQEPVSETKVASADSTSELETVRRIDAGLLNFKHGVMAMLILLISAAVYFCQPQKLPL
uniref:WIT1/2 N-terminal helical bundle domain-containing protein n=1 Tax=Salix viminalis TaxID=40686 RepID=A0A6N2LY27_SALVM